MCSPGHFNPKPWWSCRWYYCRCPGRIGVYWNARRTCLKGNLVISELAKANQVVCLAGRALEVEGKELHLESICVATAHHDVQDISQGGVRLVCSWRVLQELNDALLIRLSWQQVLKGYALKGPPRAASQKRAQIPGGADYRQACVNLQQDVIEDLQQGTASGSSARQRARLQLCTERRSQATGKQASASADQHGTEEQRGAPRKHEPSVFLRLDVVPSQCGRKCTLTDHGALDAQVRNAEYCSPEHDHRFH
mmetsp:Transcript_4046/g.6114  ORF Transcript_4046/g.6114 Transcript_4046/m.6114 type:complete len:252 (-) Transcript_4046:451-1206(-)